MGHHELSWSDREEGESWREGEGRGKEAGCKQVYTQVVNSKAEIQEEYSNKQNVRGVDPPDSLLSVEVDKLLSICY